MEYQVDNLIVPSELIEEEYKIKNLKKKIIGIISNLNVISNLYHWVRYKLTGEDEQILRGTPSQLAKKIKIDIGY